jgi:hypothetical protein
LQQRPRAQMPGWPGSTQGSGGWHRLLLRTSPASSRLVTCPGQIEFVSCGLAVRLPLLPTPPRGDAVTVGYILDV